MIHNETIQSILERRSIRKFSNKDIAAPQIDAILEAARWAPSGLNNQPWKFVVIEDSETKNRLSDYTKYKTIIPESRICVAVFYHIPSGYNRDKDILSIGAAIENMLLCSHSLGIGAVWLGEILNRKEDVNNLLSVTSDNELMAVIALGYPDEKPQTKPRKDIDEIIIKKI